MVNFASDTEMFDTMRDKLYASVISDTIDSLGARNQGMRPDVRPMWEGAVVVGRAYPVLRPMSTSLSTTPTVRR